VRDTRDARIVIPGAIYGDGYRELESHCFAYIHATEVGGTHPALIEAMGRGALVLYRNTPENAEVAGDAGIPFEPDELESKLKQVLTLSEAERAQYRARAMDRVRQRYSWDAVTDAYESPHIRGLAQRSPATRNEVPIIRLFGIVSDEALPDQPSQRLGESLHDAPRILLWIALDGMVHGYGRRRDQIPRISLIVQEFEHYAGKLLWLKRQHQLRIWK
jgi:hypothetical protein